MTCVQEEFYGARLYTEPGYTYIWTTRQDKIMDDIKLDQIRLDYIVFQSDSRKPDFTQGKGILIYGQQKMIR